MKINNDIQRAQNQELDERELEMVCGGRNECLTDYCCYTVYYHPDERDIDSACLWDYMCLWFATTK